MTLNMTIAQVLHDAPRINIGRCYIVIGPNVWGKAFVPDQAWENAGKPKKFLLFDAPPCAYVDGMGAIVWYPALYAEVPPGPDVNPMTGEPLAKSIGYPAKRLLTFPSMLE